MSKDKKALGKLTNPTVPHKTWVRPHYNAAHRMYVLKLIDHNSKTLIRFFRKDKEALERLHDKLVLSK